MPNPPNLIEWMRYYFVTKLELLVTRLATRTTVYGGANAGDDLYLTSTRHATKGDVVLGDVVTVNSSGIATTALTSTGLATVARIRSGDTGLMNDDTAVSFALPTSSGVVLLFCTVNAQTPARRNSMGIIAYDHNVATCVIFFQPATQLVAFTGPLLGTTGTDDKTNVSVDADDDRFYVENRSGLSLRLGYLILA